MSAASRCALSSDRMPVNVLITDGTKAATKMTITFAELPSPNHTIARGIQARGGIGRKVKKIGFTIASILRLAPIKIPNKTPAAADTRNAVVTKPTL